MPSRSRRNPRKIQQKFDDQGATRKVKRSLTIWLALLESAPAGASKSRAPVVRTLLVNFVALLCLGLATSAQAERRIFVIANDADGYGVDRCLAAGAKCGAAVANAYCKTQAFAEAATYHKVSRDDITGTNMSGDSGDCRAAKCEVVAIVCSR